MTRETPQLFSSFVFFQAEDGIRDLVRSRGLGDVYKRQVINVSVYPNPANESVFIEIESNSNNPITLIYSDNSGKILHQINYQITEPIEIKRNNISAGIYWIKIISGDDVVVKKIIWM